jgi:hypothetical protein
MAEVGFDAATAISDAAGRFTFLGVPPGEYELTHTNRFLASESPGRAPYWASRRIVVGTDDVSDVTVDVRSPLRVEGRIEFRGANGALVPAARRVVVVFEQASGEPTGFAAEVSQPPTFSTRAAGGRYIVRASTLGSITDNPWVVQSVTLDGKDITDRPFDLQADVTSIVITYVDRPSPMTGMVRDARGAPSAAAAVLVFPVDRAHWTGYGANPRTLQSEFTSPEGAYAIRHLPAGEYYAIAVAADAAEFWQDPRTLEKLAPQATTLTVAAGRSLTLDLTLKTVR